MKRPGLTEAMAAACADCGERPDAELYMGSTCEVQCAGCGKEAKTLSDWNALNNIRAASGSPEWKEN